MTYECRVCQDYLCFIRQDVELDDVAVTVSVDDFRVCGEAEGTKNEKKNNDILKATSKKILQGKKKHEIMLYSPENCKDAFKNNTFWAWLHQIK